MQKLLEVQEFDLKIRDLEIETAAIPRRIDARERVLDAQRAELSEVSIQLEECKKAQRHLERQLDEKQVELAKYNTQLPLIKTNREYKAILVEIDMVEKEISDLEEEILVRMSEDEQVESKVRAKEEEIRKSEEESEREKEELRKQKEALEESLKGTRSERDDLAAGIDASLLSQYDRIRLRKGGLAIAQIDDESCGACHMALPPQVVNETIGGKIKLCPSCSRLLYWNTL